MKKMKQNSEILLRSDDDVSKFLKSLEDDTKYLSLGNLTRSEYLDRVYFALNKLSPNQSVIIDRIVKEENKELFLQCVCLFIIETNNSVEFSNDFLLIKKLK